MKRRLAFKYNRLNSSIQIYCLFIISIFLISTEVNSKGFVHLSSNDGLKNSIVRAISKSNDGFVWLGTLKGLYRYDGYNLNHMLMPNGEPFEAVRSIQSDSHGNVWIATKNNGLFYYKTGIIHKFELSTEQQGIDFQIHMVFDNLNYFVFSHAIYKLENLTLIDTFENPVTGNIYSGVTKKQDQLLLGTKANVYLYDLMTNTLDTVHIDSTIQNRRQHVLHQDSHGFIWLGRSDGLYKYQPNCECFISQSGKLEGIEIYKITSDHDSLWVGTNSDGLYRYQFSDASYEHFGLEKDTTLGIVDNSVISLDVSDGAILWLGTFNAGANFIDLNQLKWGSVPGVNHPVGCLPSKVVFGIYEESEHQLWIGTNQGLVYLDLKKKECQIFDTDSAANKSVSGQSVYSLRIINNQLWLTGSAGVDILDLHTKTVNPWSESALRTGTFFLFKHQDGRVIVGTSKGLYSTDEFGRNFHSYQSEQGEDINALFYHFLETPNGYYFGTTQGVYKLVGDALQYIPINIDANTAIKDVSGMAYDPIHGLLIAADRKHLFLLNSNSEVKDLSHLIKEDNFTVSVFEMMQDDNGLFWMSTDNGIYRLNLNDQTVHNFQSTDGLQSNNFLKISSHKGKSGKFYFGGRNGFNAFYPEDIKINETPPKVVLTEVSQLNKTIGMGESTRGGFLLEKPVEHLDFLELGHKDLAIGFEFAALDYADSSRNQYAYRLLGFNDEWSYVGADDRRANYTNLKPGDYTFQVKASNKDGIWNHEPKELKIKVYPAPWLSPWAYAAYVLIVLISVWGFIRYKTIASRRRAEELEVTVTERTQEVVQQKRMVESLLDHKNEVFANVTHEFKTPLALIVGPADQLTDEPELKKFDSQLSMIQRNANRLLLMVGQILKLSQAEQEKEVIRVPQAVQPTLLMLFESFNPLAKNKAIHLSLSNNHDVNVYATSDCIETVVGNLISNAIKYTQKGGHVTIKSSVTDEQVSISVKDSGPGIKEQDLGKIFKRFTRLDNHQSIQGTGIGLSVVKEVTEANNGFVTVNSEWGSGSEFIVTFPVSHLQVDGTMSRVMTDQLVSNTESELKVDEVAVMPSASSKKQAVTVLIIEDNLDMQKHTGHVLKDRFNCLFADRGEKGIAMALKEVPDVIICDVMMPGMDGYQVTRILRHDERTSHIPIILLTALNTKESRIKGWREKIDRYMTKPFDATELNVQLDSILSLRKLLQEKTNQVINEPGSLEQLDLPKQDLIFIEKLKAVIAQYYNNEYFQKADLASKMAISERQLQRKIKAMLGIGPLDMLRDFRLEQSKLKLKEGFQVGQVSDECGFSSVSYFGTCFKKKYGMTPKQYQQLGRNESENQ